MRLLLVPWKSVYESLKEFARVEEKEALTPPG
jgi:hypothetical protein